MRCGTGRTYVPTPEDLTVLLESVNAAHIGELMEVAPDGDVLLTKVVKPSSPEADSAVPIDIGSIKQSYPPDLQDQAVKTVLAQGELLCAGCVRCNDQQVCHRGERLIYLAPAEPTRGWLSYSDPTENGYLSRRNENPAVQSTGSVSQGGNLWLKPVSGTK